MRNHPELKHQVVTGLGGAWFRSVAQAACLLKLEKWRDAEAAQISWKGPSSPSASSYHYRLVCVSFFVSTQIRHQ